MRVSELIEMLQGFPQDAKVAAYDTTNELCVVLKGGVVLAEPGELFPYDSEQPSVKGQPTPEWTGPCVSIMGGEWTYYGDITEKNQPDKEGA